MKRKYTGAPASSEFKAAVDGGGSTCVTCGFCDREHVAIDSSNHGLSSAEDGYDETQGQYVFAHDCMRDEIIQKAKEDPDSWVLVNDVDCIHYAMIGGVAIPDDCPCNGLARYEKFIMDEFDVIKRYVAIKKLSLQKELDSLGNLE
jgi:hypothetical protein